MSVTLSTWDPMRDTNVVNAFSKSSAQGILKSGMCVLVTTSNASDSEEREKCPVLGLTPWNCINM